MEFKCPKCGYVLSGTPDECPLCHNKLNYHVNLEGAEQPRVEPKAPEVKGEIVAPKKEGKGNIITFNIFAILYNLVCLGLFAFALLWPAFIMNAENTDIYASILSGSAVIPEGQAFSLLDYYVVQMYTYFVQIIPFAGSNTDAVIFLGVGLLFNFLEILFIFLGVLLGTISLICNLVNLFTGRLPKYVKRSVVETFHDPLNPMGHIITFLAFFALDLFVPSFINQFISNLGIGLGIVRTLEVMKTPQSFFPIMAFGAVFVIAIVKTIIRGSVNPKRR